MNPCCLDGFVKDTALPSEDFEIVYAAMTIPSDLFVTDDQRLIKCAWSLGLNYSLNASCFCKSDDYQVKTDEITQSCGL